MSKVKRSQQEVSAESVLKALEDLPPTLKIGTAALIAYLLYRQCTPERSASLDEAQEVLGHVKDPNHELAPIW